jgi:MORN repeat variant
MFIFINAHPNKNVVSKRRIRGFRFDYNIPNTLSVLASTLKPRSSLSNGTRPTKRSLTTLPSMCMLFKDRAPLSMEMMMSTRSTPLNGPHQELFADGSLSGEGRLKDGKRHGKWTWYYKNGGLKAVGKYADGELDGYWEWWRENGKPLQAGAFSGGQQVGSWKRYYENGQLWDEGIYEGGKKVGEWKVYDKSGGLKQSKIFKLKK